jgi:hypothetical protein
MRIMNALKIGRSWIYAVCLALVPVSPAAESSKWVTPDANAGKQIVLRLGQKEDAALVWDTELMRVSSGWTGRFDTPIRFVPRAEFATNIATLIFASSNRPGWGMKGNLKDPRTGNAGPLPAEWAAYRGLYQAGSQVVLSYSVGGSSVLELPGYDSASGIFSRTFAVDKSDTAMALLVCNVPPHPGKREIVEKSGNGEHGYLALNGTNSTTVAAIQGAPRETSWENVDGCLYLRLPPLDKPATFRVSVWHGDQDEGLTGFVETIARNKAIADPREILK